MTARASLSVSVAQVLRRAGVQHPLSRVVTVADLTVGEASIPSGTPIEVDLVLEATGNAVVATGTLRTTATCECRRCLDRFEEPLTATVREIFDPHPVEGETYPLQSELIDLAPLVRDTLLLSLPLAPLCRADCPGPAPERFPTVVEADGDHGAPDAGEATPGPDADVDAAPAAPPRDPRWAALDQLQLDR
ncbi:MAG: DUF177 domain-containing protein [Acidimicrobiia bacterium]